MSIRQFFIYLILFLLPGIATSQSYFFNHYEQENGIIDEGLNCMVQDNYGYLWIGSNQGLSRFDGHSFEEIEYSNDIENDPVYDLMVDNQGLLWVASNMGVTSYDGINFRYYSISTNNDSLYCYGLSEGSKEEILFFYGGKNFYSIRNDDIQDLSNRLASINGNIISVGGRKLEDLKILTSEGEIWISQQKGFHRIINDPDFDNILIKGDGQVYAISSQQLVRLGFKGEEITTDTTFNISDLKITNILESENGETWICEDEKLFVYKDEKVIELNKSVGFTSGAVESLFEDIEGNIWILTKDNGLFCYHGDELRYLEFSENQSFTPTSFYRNELNQLYVSYFGKGIHIYEDNKIRKIIHDSGITSNYVRSVIKHNDTYWLITAKGVTSIIDGNIRSYTTSNGLPHNYCYHACVDSDENIWIGTEGGVGIFDGNKFRIITQEDGIFSNRIKYLLPEDNGAMLLLSDYGINRIKEGNISPFIHEGLKNKEVLNTIISDNLGNYWIGSDINGLIFYDNRSKKVKYINQYFNTPFSRVRSLIFYKDNWLCIGTERGIYYLKVTTNGEISSLYPVGIEQGYPDFEVNQNAALKIEDDIYFGTSVGILIFNPGKISKNKSIPVHVTDLSIEFRETDWSQTKESLNTWLGTPVNPVLNHNQNDLQIKFKGISLKSKEKLWYRYQLVEYDQDWSKPIDSESVLYANLTPGKYQFKTSASYDGLNWNDTYTSYHFIIAPPFWRTWWFFVIVIAFVLVGFVLVNNYRIRTRVNQLLLIEKLNKEEYEKIQKKVAMDFHDEVGNHLTSISLLVQLIRSRNWKVPKELQDFLDKIDLESKNLFLGTKDFIWSIDPKNNNLKEVFYKIKDYGEEVFDSTDIKFNVKNGVGEDINIELPAGFTRQIVLIFKEAINNARQHAGCRNVQFSVSTYPEMFLIRLSDDGIGFNTEEIEYYNGLKKMKIRGEKIKGDLIFNSEPESGTEIILKANLNKDIAN